jgi:hypothetical protein
MKRIVGKASSVVYSRMTSHRRVSMTLTGWILLAILLSLYGCSSFTYTVDNDPFTKTTNMTITTQHPSVKGDLYNTYFIYRRGYKDGNKLPMTVQFEIDDRYVYPYATMTGNEISVLIGDNPHNVKYKTVNTVSDEGIRGSGSVASGSISYHENMTVMKTFTASFTLDGALEKEILGADRLMYRVHADKDTTTFEVTPRQLAKIQEVLRAEQAGSKR